MFDNKYKDRYRQHVYICRERDREGEIESDKQTDRQQDREREYRKIKIQLYYHDVGDGFRILPFRSHT